MEKSKVYFTSFRTKMDVTLQMKLRKLIETAGIRSMDLNGKFTAIKIHFGEPGNLAMLRPNYARTVADVLKEMGARPFLTDCNTLYTGMRRNALDHMLAAQENGFGYMETGCHVMIADGLLGTDDVAVPVKDGVYCKEALIGRAIMDAEAVISLNHFKCHEATGIGGALKNLGMGCGSTGGKRVMHQDGKPTVISKACIGCGRCASHCAHGAISFVANETGKGRKAVIDHNLCVGCSRCVGVCRDRGAIMGINSSNDMLCCKISEYAKAVIDGRPNFHINLVCNVSPFCDCHCENDAPIIADIGMFASFDPVALDMACAEAVASAPRLPGTYLGDCKNHSGDNVNDIHPTTNWRSGLEHAVKIGIGSMDYELITVE